MNSAGAVGDAHLALPHVILELAVDRIDHDLRDDATAIEPGHPVMQLRTCRLKAPLGSHAAVLYRDVEHKHQVQLFREAKVVSVTEREIRPVLGPGTLNLKALDFALIAEVGEA